MATGGLTHMNYHNSNSSNSYTMGSLSTPGAGFGSRSRLNNKRLSVALPPKVNSISEHTIDNPTPRTSRSHLLAGLRTQPKTPSLPASAPYHQTQHHIPDVAASSYTRNYASMPVASSTLPGADYNKRFVPSTNRQIYPLPQHVLAPPAVYEQAEEMDPNVLHQMQMTSLYLAQRQQQLQQQLANITAAAQSMDLNGLIARQGYAGISHMPQSVYAPQQIQEVPGQPGVYLVFNAATQTYSYFTDPNVQQYVPTSTVPVEQPAVSHQPLHHESLGTVKQTSERSFSPPKKTPSPPAALEAVEPLPPPSLNAFRRGHKKASSLAINASGIAADGPKTSSAATFGTQRAVIPPAPMTGTFGPGGARAGEHPLRQPRGPPPLEELLSAPTSKHEGSKNFATRQRRRALDNLMKAGTQRRGVSSSAGGSPSSEEEFNFRVDCHDEELPSLRGVSRKMSPIGSEMKEKRSSQGSSDGYFGLSSASSSEGEEAGAYKLPLTQGYSLGGDPDAKKASYNTLPVKGDRCAFGI